MGELSMTFTKRSVTTTKLFLKISKTLCGFTEQLSKAEIFFSAL
jgi:hypothetical protein